MSAADAVRLARDSYERVRGGKLAVAMRWPAVGLLHWKSGEVARVPCADAAAALRALPLKAMAGWLRCQGEPVVVQGPHDVPTDDAILEGELHMSDGSTLLLRPDGRGQVRILEQRDAPAAFAGSDFGLAHDVEHVATPRAKAEGIEALTYRVYFAIDPEQGAVPVACRFTGFRRSEAGMP